MGYTLYTIGYGSWEARQRMQKMLAELIQARVTTLVDVRHSPCASSSDPSQHYGPRAWNLQAQGGIAEALKVHGIEYRWLVELGNPQKRDLAMTILQAHLASADENYPVHRGLRLLADLVHEKDRICCILCACARLENCHRLLIAEHLAGRHFGGDLAIIDLSRVGQVVVSRTKDGKHKTT